MIARSLDRPIRVVLFGGPYLERAAVRFAVMLDEHPEVEFLAGFCQATGAGWRYQIVNLVQRRGLLALPILAMQATGAMLRVARHPVAEFAFHQRASRVLARVETVPDIHALQVLDRVRALQPDLGLIYGGPILRPELFDIPRLGTLGIHHGKVPDYRGKKTTFWAMYNGEWSAGVTIQRVNAGIDTGDVVREGEVPIPGKSYGRVEAELEELGLALYLEAVLAIKQGAPTYQPQRPGTARLYRQPTVRDIAWFWWMRLCTRRGGP